MIDISLLFPSELKDAYSWLSGVGTWEEYEASQTGPRWMHIGIFDDGQPVAVISCELYGEKSQYCGFHISKKPHGIMSERLREIVINLAAMIFRQGVQIATASFPFGNEGAQRLVESCGMRFYGHVGDDLHYLMTAEEFKETHERAKKAAV